MNKVYIIIGFLIFGVINSSQGQFDAVAKPTQSDADMGIEKLKEDIANTKDPAQKKLKEEALDKMLHPEKYVMEEGGKSGANKDDKKYYSRPKKNNKGAMSLEDKRKMEQREKSMENREKINKLKEVRRDKLQVKLAESKKAYKEGKARLDKLVAKIEKDKSAAKLTEEAYASKLELIKIIETNLSDLQIKMDRATLLVEDN